MSKSDSAHKGKTVSCRGRVDGKMCGKELNWMDHGSFIRNHSDFEAAGLEFTCPDCGRRNPLCPICSEPDDSDDNSPAGWFRGESSNEQLACHNCNPREYARQRRSI